jgi:hypothetical protein
MARKTSSSIQLVLAPVLIAAILFLELKHPFPKFRLATLILVFALFVDLASLARGGTRNLLIALASLVLGLSIAEGAAGAGTARSVLTIDRGWSVPQPVMGWGPEKAGTFHAKMTDTSDNSTIYETDYTFDFDLLRHTAAAETGPTVVFFGDSFTFGDGVRNDETLPQAFADLTDQKLRVLNLALTGYSPQQFLREMETGRFDKVIGPDPKLFVFLTAPWHAERTSCKAYWTAHAPLYALENGRVAFKGACNEGASLLWREWLNNSALYRYFAEPWRHRVSNKDVELYVSVLEAAVKMAKEKYGAPTVIPYLSVPEQYLAGTGFTDESIMQRLSDAGAIVIQSSLKKEEAAGQQISIRIDSHPTPLANRLRAAQIKAAIDEKLPGVLLADAKQE